MGVSLSDGGEVGEAFYRGLRAILVRLRGIVELRHDALDKSDGLAVILQNAFLGLCVFRAERLSPSLPPVHEVVGVEGVPKQFSVVAFEFAEDFAGELVVLIAERRDPSLEWKGCPVAQMSREAYEFFSLSFADFGLDTS